MTKVNEVSINHDSFVINPEIQINQKEKPSQQIAIDQVKSQKRNVTAEINVELEHPPKIDRLVARTPIYMQRRHLSETFLSWLFK